MSLNVSGQRTQRMRMISVITHKARHCVAIIRPLLGPETRLRDILTAVYRHLHNPGHVTHMYLRRAHTHISTHNASRHTHVESNALTQALTYRHTKEANMA